MANQADYSKLKTPSDKCAADKEESRIRSLDIRYGSVVIPYKGNDIWMGLKGKRLLGEVAAIEYAKKLSGLMDRMQVKI